MPYTIDSRLDTPIYRQLADAILSDIHAGILPGGSKLPPVRELSEGMDLSLGTIKHAYDYLEDLGIIEMTRGKGTFVREQSQSDAGSRKDRAMAAIDSLFTELEDLGFTPREMEIYINLKLQGLEEKYDVVRVAAIDCNPETLQLIESQLSQISYAQVAIFSLSQLPELTEKLNSQYDLVLTTSTHYSELETFMQDKQTLGMLAMMPSAHTLVQLAQIPADASVGIVCASENFASIVRQSCNSLGSWSDRIPVQFLGHSASGKSLQDFLKSLNTLILPERYESFAMPEEKILLKEFQKSGGRIVRYEYLIDRGSFLYVQHLVKRIMNKKRSV